MKHLTDEELLAEPTSGHLSSCSLCSARKRELEEALAAFAGARLEQELPPMDSARAMLLARMADVPDRAQARFDYRLGAAALAGVCVAICVTVWVVGPFRFMSREAAAVPNPRLTPGATILATREDVCRDLGDSNRTVPVSLQKKVFESYGIPNAEPRAYEVDYLITPALGGADDINNLWPQPYGSTVWNARVKDALEDHLRDLVCEGKVDLPTAQREIATNWIAAYKKYFKTNRPRNLDN